ADVQLAAEQGHELVLKSRLGLVTPQLGLIRMLRGLTAKFGSFDDEQFNELRFEEDLASGQAALHKCFYWILKLQGHFFAGAHAQAVEASLKAQQLLWTAPSHFETAAYHFYSALARAVLLNSGRSPSALAKEEHFTALIRHHQQIALWAKNCPENF